MTKHLGKKTSYPSSYSPELLERIPRKVDRNIITNGEDRWTLYELSWLNTNGIPKSGIGLMTIPLDSHYILESKSLKLYLNSLNNEIFDSEKTYLEKIKKRIS